MSFGIDFLNYMESIHPKQLPINMIYAYYALSIENVLIKVESAQTINNKGYRVYPFLANGIFCYCHLLKALCRQKFIAIY